MILRSILLRKVDLVSQMVFNLSYISYGRILLFKNNKSAVKSINEHYSLKTRDDDLPFSNSSIQIGQYFR